MIELAPGYRCGELIVVAIGSGLRIGELQALQWKHISFDDCQLRVEQTLESVAGRGGGQGYLQLKPPKSKKSRRTVALGPMAVAALQSHRRKMEAEETSVIDDAPVFPNVDGGWFDKSSFYRLVWRPIKAAAHIPPKTRVHDLRHTRASVLLCDETVSDKVVQDRLGHSTFAVTMDVYGHVMTGRDKSAADSIDSILTD